METEYELRLKYCGLKKQNKKKQKVVDLDHLKFIRVRDNGHFALTHYELIIYCSM